MNSNTDQRLVTNRREIIGLTMSDFEILMKHLLFLNKFTVAQWV
jgi:hypothetical protein